MEKQYNPSEFETRVYKGWEESGSFNPDLTKEADAPTFLITMPPPNVTGVLHQGHALFAAIEDAFTRWKRMRGYRTLWLPGTDHAGISTQLMVERMLESEGTSRVKVGREEFLRRTFEWKEKHGGIIQNQLRALGSSCDWSRERYTMDDKSNEAVKSSFMRFYHEGLIFQGERIVNWSTGLNTAVSDLEVVTKTLQGNLYHIKYELEDGSDHLVVATTRPETLFADTAVALNPEDERFKAFHGKKVKLPLTDRLLPIILDEYVDIEFGTGALKVTPGHDHNDWALGNKHKLETINMIDRTGLVNDLAPPIAGLTVKEARKKTVQLVEEKNLLVKKETYAHEVGHCERSGVIIEPLVSVQWWMNMKPLAANALIAGKEKAREKRPLRYFPEFWEKTYFEWLNKIEAWCISRQLWWGHQIPAWHCDDCTKITVPKTIEEGDPTECTHCKSKKIVQDKDVLDTWYSSSLWPITTLGWPHDTKDLQTFYPTIKYNEERTGEIRALMETGSDIIFFWVTRMVMMCTHLMDGRLPFEDIYLHAMIRDGKGQKMSKTKGNVVDPMVLINEHGADALRLTLLALSGGGHSVNFDIKRLEGYKAFVNKLWNACRYSFPLIKEEHGAYFNEPWTAEELKACSVTDRWILHRSNMVTIEVNRHLEQYRFDMAFSEIYQFTWYEFCDWYLELSKIEDLSEKRLQKVLHNVLGTIMKLLHPLAPFVTEEIFGQLPAVQEKLITCAFPVENKLLEDSAAVEEIDTLRNIVERIRHFRTENKIKPKQVITAVLTSESTEIWMRVKDRVCALANFTCTEGETPSGPCGKVSVTGFEFSLPLEGIVEKSAEVARLKGEIKKLEKDLAFVVKRLNNKNFVDRAKPELVDKERKRKDDYADRLKTLEDALQSLNA